MVQKPTTLVLGAGASQTYSFPSGRQLREIICGLSGGQAFDLLVEHYTSREVERFCDAFRRSQMYSIDAFLARRPEFAEIGKATIASILIQRENSDSFLHSPEDNWYAFLWNRIAESWDALAQSNLAIITFNYDRSLEYFLLEAMKHSFGKSHQDCATQLRTIPIVHVYGLLGEPDFAAPNGRAYEPRLTSLGLKTATEGIRVIPEYREHDDTFKGFVQARKLLSTASTICFLGFGYDKLNMQRLGIDASSPELHSNLTRGDRVIYGTTLGLQGAERKSVATLLQRDVAYFPQSRCEEMLRSYGILDLPISPL